MRDSHEYIKKQVCGESRQEVWLAEASRFLYFYLETICVFMTVAKMFPCG